jgi:hypothetical protein
MDYSSASSVLINNPCFTQKIETKIEHEVHIDFQPARECADDKLIRIRREIFPHEVDMLIEHFDAIRDEYHQHYFRNLKHINELTMTTIDRIFMICINYIDLVSECKLIEMFDTMVKHCSESADYQHSSHINDTCGDVADFYVRHYRRT